MRRHLNTLQQKPEHVRQKIAAGAAGAITALVAVVWLGSHVANESFAIQPASPAAEDATPAFAGTREGFSELLGAVGSAVGATSTAPELTIVDGNTTTTITPQPTANHTNETVIAF